MKWRKLLLVAEKLRQSVLKRAFESKLMPQDPNDEPASVLLERILAERAVTSNSTTSDCFGRQRVFCAASPKCWESPHEWASTRFVEIYCKRARWKMSPEPLPEGNYARQQRYDRTIDSICTRCFLVVGRGCNEADLAHLESKHLCQLVERRQAIRFADPRQPKPMGRSPST